MHFHNYASAIIIQSVIQNADLFRSENPVAGIAETGNDIAVIVEVAVNRGGVDDNIGVQLMQHFNALGSGNKAHQANGFAACLLDDANTLGQRSRRLQAWGQQRSYRARRYRRAACSNS